MADVTPQGAGQFSTNIESTVTNAQTYNYEVAPVSGGATMSTRYLIDVEPGLDVQQDTFTIDGAPVADDDIRLQVTDAGGAVGNYIKLVDASEAGNFEKVVNDFVAIINVDDDIVATIDSIDTGTNSATIRLTSAKGEAFTAVTSVGAGTMTLGAITNDVAGDPVANLKRRLFAEVDVTFALVDGIATWTPVFKIYDAAPTNPAISTTLNLGAVRHNKNITECE